MHKYEGLFVGTAVGDAMGLPREGLSPRRAKRIFGEKIQPALIVVPFITRFSTCSDDTEHLWLTADALVRCQGRIEYFERILCKNLKYWLLSFPVGAGKASIKSSFKLLCGISPRQSGTFSAGNGPVMRAPIIGAFFANNNEKLEEYLKISTHITHTDPLAYEGSWVIAQAAALLNRQSFEIAPIELFFNIILPKISSESLKTSLLFAKKSLLSGTPFLSFLREINCDRKGISGYVGHTVPAVVYAWLYYFGDYQKGIEAIISAGGDSDTTAAILGALLGINQHDNIPTEWQSHIFNAPISISKLKRMANAVAYKDIKKLPSISWLMQLARNSLLLFIVLVHGFRRLLPPY